MSDPTVLVVSETTQVLEVASDRDAATIWGRTLLDGTPANNDVYAWVAANSRYELKSLDELGPFVREAGDTMTGDLKMTTSDILPTTDNTGNLGLTAKRWTSIWGYAATITNTLTAATGTFTNVDGILGANTAAAATVTDLASTGDTTIGNATGDALTYHPSAWTLTNAVTITGTWADLGTVSAATSITSTAFVGPLTGNADTATLAATVTVVDGTDTTSFVAIFDSATGSLPVKTDGALLYNASTGDLQATIFTGAIGSTTPAAGAFTTGSFSGVLTVSDVTDTSGVGTGSGRFAGGVDIAKGLYVAGAVTVGTVNGINFGPGGGDADMDIFTVDVAGAPTVYWDESADTLRTTGSFGVQSILYVGGLNANITGPSGLLALTSLGGAGTNQHQFVCTGAMTGTGAHQYLIRIVSATFAPTSGAAKFHGFHLAPTINQTGTASGDYSILKIMPTITASTGTNKYLIEVGIVGNESLFTISEDGSGFATSWSDLGTVTTVDVDGGTIDGTVIGGAVAAAGTFNALSATSFSLTDVMTVTGAAPVYYLVETGGTVNESTWRMMANADQFTLSTMADDLLSGVAWMTVTRTLNVVDLITLTGPTTVAGGGTFTVAGTSALSTVNASGNIAITTNNLFLIGELSGGGASALIGIDGSDIVQVGGGQAVNIAANATITGATYRANSGGYYWSAQGTAAVAVATTYVKVSTASSTTSSRALNFTISTDNRATYTGTPTQTFRVTYSFTCTAEASNKTLGFKIAKGGVVIDGSMVNRRIGTNSDEGSVTVEYFVELATNDYVELWATNDTDTNDAYVLHGSCTITEA